MARYVEQNNSRRMAVFGAIIGFHLLLVYGLVSGLARKVVEVVAPPLVTDIIEEIKPEDKPPPPPPPQMERPPVQVPPPDVVIDIPMETQTTAISNVTDKPAPAVVAPPAPRSILVRKRGANGLGRTARCTAQGRCMTEPAGRVPLKLVLFFLVLHIINQVDRQLVAAAR
mgnify:CR=1 FL=1